VSGERRDAGGRSVLVVGATGLVGRECVRQLLDHPEVARVVALVRRALPAELRGAPGGAKLEECVVDFDRLADHADAFRVEQIVCALGTTIKQAGSQERFRRVDFDYPLAVARLGLQHGARHFLLVSSLGASARSRVFYSRVKGELEDAVLALSYRSVTIVRPSLLLGERGEFRLGEAIAKRLAFLSPPKYKPVEARDVAAALVQAAARDEPGRRMIESAEIRKGTRGFRG
jgi:uncharacterized protein YbjT (DUF2867 family)